MSEQKKTESIIRRGVEFHGHLGAFLVIGLRMGTLAKRHLKDELKDRLSLRATLNVPFRVPFSCTIDGVQVTTCCTVGNRRLSLQNSRGEIVGTFIADGSRKALKVRVKPEIVKDLIKKRTNGVSNEELAGQVSRMSDDQLFTLSRR
jgi:formylmethanofuran dehydrogenase subunit E